jgi:hypothetical protein
MKFIKKYWWAFLVSIPLVLYVYPFVEHYPLQYFNPLNPFDVMRSAISGIEYDIRGYIAYFDIANPAGTFTITLLLWRWILPLVILYILFVFLLVRGIPYLWHKLQRDQKQMSKK